MLTAEYGIAKIRQFPYKTGYSIPPVMQANGLVLDDSGTVYLLGTGTRCPLPQSLKIMYRFFESFPSTGSGAWERATYINRKKIEKYILFFNFLL
jgi:hypothetical protein